MPRGLSRYGCGEIDRDGNLTASTPRGGGREARPGNLFVFGFLLQIKNSCNLKGRAHGRLLGIYSVCRANQTTPTVHQKVLQECLRVKEKLKTCNAF